MGGTSILQPVLPGENRADRKTRKRLLTCCRVFVRLAMLNAGEL